MVFYRWDLKGVRVLLGLLLPLMAGFVPSAEALEIKVKEQATVISETVILKDIALFQPPEDPRASRLAEIEVASAPSPGQTVKFNKQFLSYKIGSAVSDIKDIEIIIPDSLEIRRTAQIFRGKALEEIFRDYVTGHARLPEDKIHFGRINTPGDIAFPVGRLQWDVLGKGGRYLGNVSIIVSFSVDGRQVRRVPVYGRVSVSQELIKAGRKIKTGQIIDRGDLIKVEEDTTNLREQILVDMDEVIGKRAVRNIQEGQMIAPAMFENPPLVKKGSRVVIKAENKTLRVTTIGKVLEDGRKGEQVKVLNVRSGKEVVSVVRGPGLVEVLF
jgi:flagella basal body P-ring formation protein FlgA